MKEINGTEGALLNSFFKQSFRCKISLEAQELLLIIICLLAFHLMINIRI